MSLPAGWKFISHGAGWAAWAATVANSEATAPTPARHVFIALIISPAIGRKQLEQCRSENPPGILMSGSNHTLFPSARKEHRNPCGIFARGWPFTAAAGDEKVLCRALLEG
jgi:hypothetical protein